MSKKPETVEVASNVVDLEEIVLVSELGEEAGRAEYARRKAAHPDGVLRKVVKLTDAQRAQIRSSKLLTVKELAKHFKVSPTTIANVRNAEK